MTPPAPDRTRFHRITLDAPDDFDGWRDAARRLLAADVPPERVSWQVAGAESDLFGADDASLPPATGAPVTVGKDFISLARTAICHRDPERFGLLYAMLWRLKGDRAALQDRADPLVTRLRAMEKEVRRDAHKMHAFVRFREVEEEDGVRMVAWFEPDNHIVRREAGFFMRRFTNMRWSILTPDLSIHWDGETLTTSPGATRRDAPDGDPVEETWKAYYKSIFNPARVKVKAMTAEMPRKYWKNMPETAAIGELLAGAQAREAAMIEKSRSEAEPPPPPSNAQAAWEALRHDIQTCRRCDLYCDATQPVFGEGPLSPRLFIVGEQPGDQEDLAGRPFVGPAGALLDEAMAEAGIERDRCYVTNAVKHFKFVQRGKRRIHQTPTVGEIKACNWWLEQERALVRPPLVVALGASAARALMGKAVTISKVREEGIILPDGSECRVTVHPSYLLRLPDEGARRDERARFVEDLRRAAQRADALAA
ncbi:UdgX family uracil-DNA binding protein [Sphingomicrobium lutaoense]|uniref:Type-4 uracil-DNA glycosylase n=1 Tax=Sphingomicrobium lutaoense TaxID=515949 RepID=A0A839YW84_9SPHN|nr:UdgX family uracil-DNA binding protein [Sphingomicrobium lutaoense]MBB3764471.1 DNA polymerase [Sphingomicrobium lutaoense]